MNKIIISIPLVWGVRNFLISGIVQRLETSFELYYAVPAIAKPYMLERGIPQERLLILKSQKSSVLQRWCSLIIRHAHRRRFPTKSDEVFKPLTSVSAVGIRDFFLNIASFVFSVPFLFRLLEQLDQKFFTARIDPQLKTQVELINPVFALSTSYVVDTEWSLFRMLREQGIAIYTHILSFDNLTSRGYLPIKYFDKFLVWNTKMAQELQFIYSVSAAKIIITGTPQFDFHVNQQYIRSREWTQEKLGIREGAYLVYCANHYALTPDEPQLVAQIITTFRENPALASYQVVLRLHPMDDYDRWNDLKTRFPFVCLSYPWEHKDKQHLFWGDPSLDDMVLFSNTLRYSNLVLNIASTISIDAAIHDKPVVCVGFSSDKSNMYDSLYRNFHHSHHYAPIMETGATPLATDLENLMELSLQGIRHPARLSEKRRRMVQLLCGNMDGDASERILKFMLDLKEGKHHGK